ncbi:MAG: hypothetical protein Q9168_005433 [Polycauliona sp. 1 TL-2023]
MRSLMLILVCALSVSARCVKRQSANNKSPVVQKSAATVQTGSGRKLLEDSSAGSGTPTNTTTTSNDQQNDQSSDKQGSSKSEGATSSDGTSTSSNKDATKPEDSVPSPSPSSGTGDQSSTGGTSSTTSDKSSGDSTKDTSNTDNGATSSSDKSSGDSNKDTSNTDNGSTSSNGSGSTPSNTTNTDTGSGGNQTSSTPSTGGGGGSGSCGAMKNVCFNSGMQPAMFDLMTTASSWITFGLDIPGGSPSPRAKQGHIPMMAFQTHVAEAIKLVNGPDAPEWMLTFNEPDFAYMDSTPTMDAKTAAAAIKPLLDNHGTKTKFVAPALAFTDKGWLENFFAECNCKDFFSAYNFHSYTNDAQTVKANIGSFHSKWSDKPIWITELAPQGCGKSPEAVGHFFEIVFKFSKGSGFVDKVFWNTGNQIDAKDTNVCDSWLVDGSGKPGPLLDIFEKMEC